MKIEDADAGYYWAKTKNTAPEIIKIVGPFKGRDPVTGEVIIRKYIEQFGDNLTEDDNPEFDILQKIENYDE